MTKPIPFRAAAQAAALLCGCLLAWADPASAFTPVHSKAGSGENTPLALNTSTTGTHTSSGGASIVRTIVGLAIVIAVIWGLAWILRQVKSGRDPRVSASGLTSVAALTLGSGRSVHLVKAGNDYILLGAAEQGLAPIHRYTEQQAYEAGLLFDEEPEARPRRRLLLPSSSSSPEARVASRPSEVLDASRPSTLVSPGDPTSPASLTTSSAAARVPPRLESGERRTDPMRMPSVSSSLIERLRELTVRR
jgi:flagellar protein FliO/FliZ